MKRSVALGAAAGVGLGALALAVVLVPGKDTPPPPPPAPPPKAAPPPVATGARTVATLTTRARTPVKLPPQRERGPAKADALDVKGTVQDLEGKPVAGARVRLATDKAEVTTGPDGAFGLFPWGVEPGHKLALVVEGPASFASRVIGGIAPGTEGLVIVLRDGDAQLRGRVVRAKDGAPVAGARVEGTFGDWLGRAETDAAGAYSFGGTPAGPLALVVTAPGFVPRTFSVQATRGKVIERDLPLETGTTITGRVFKDGRPSPRASVLLRLSGVPVAFERRTAVTGADGSFAFDAIPGCEANVRARTGDSVSPVVVVYSDGANENPPVTLELGPGAWITGTVKGDQGPVARALLTATDPDGEKVSGLSDAQGRFRLGPLPAEGGACEVRVEAKGYAPRTLSLAPGDASIDLARGATLTVVVEPGEGVQVEVQGASGERRLAVASAPRAEVRLDDLPAGNAWVVARAPGRALVARQVAVPPTGARVELSLPAAETLEGRVVDDDGLPVPGAALVAIDPDSGPLGAARTATAGLDGAFSIAGAPAQVRLIGSAPGHQDAQLDCRGGARGVVLTLPRSYGLEVRVTLPPRDPGEHEGHSHGQHGRVLVRVSGPGGSDRRFANAEGSVAVAHFESLRAGAHRLEVLSPGCAPVRLDVDPRARDVVEVALPAGVHASGVVVGPDGQPLVGAAISHASGALDEDLMDEGAFATLLGMTEEGGVFEVEVAPGGEEVLVSHPEHAPLVTRLEPGEGKRLELAPGSRISGRTLDRDGRPQGSVGVALEGPVTRRASSGADGVFLFTGLPPGSYLVKRHDAPPEAGGIEVTVGRRGESSVDLKAP